MIQIDTNKCIGCNACIRACPVNDANIAQTINRKNIISVNDENCIHCGECTKECPHDARYFEDDTPRFFRDLQHKQIAVLVTPAVKVAFRNDWGALLNWLREQRSIVGIYDVSFGADICTYMHLKAVHEKKVGKIISQPCAALTDYILKYRHELIPYLSPIHSPILCAAVYLRKYCNITQPLAVLSPCIAKKTEFEDTGIVSYNVVFSELKKYLAAHQIRLSSSQSFAFDGVPALSGAIYPMPGRLKECLLAMEPELNVINSEGVPTVYHNLDMYAKTPDSIKPDVFDVLSCEYGCISGPGVPHSITYFEMMNTMCGVKQDAFTQQEKQINHRKKNKQYLKFDSQLKLEDFVRTYQPKQLHLPDIGSQELENAFQSLHKITVEERKIDCQACGYPTCKHMAMAISRGLNSPTNCHQYVLKENQDEERRIKESADRTLGIQQQINALSDELIQEISSMNTYSDNITSRARENIAAIESIQDTIRHFQDLSNVILDDISQIRDINEQYMKNSKVIKDIALHIKLVSLNASVEAARAGNAGREFAVVAREVGELANKTQFATHSFDSSSADVNKKTDSIRTNIEEVCDIVSQLSDTLNGLKAVFENTGSMGNEISRLSSEVHTISDRMQQIMNN